MLAKLLNLFFLIYLIYEMKQHEKEAYPSMFENINRIYTTA